eukprot:4006041-Amphidinium_carterae.1
MRSSRPLAAPRLATSAVAEDILPMPPPFPDADEIVSWPKSPRRQARIRRHRLRQKWCNHIVGYLSWVTLGKPGGLPADPRLVAPCLTTLQQSTCDRLWRDLGALVRPG